MISIEKISSSVLFRLIAFLGSTLLLCAVSLVFAIGSYVWTVYYGYFKTPLIFILNWLPILVLQMVILSACGKQWLAFLINSVLTFLPAIGNYFKLSFRDDPFVFSDITSIRAGLAVAGDYDLQISTKIVVAVIFVFLGTVTLAFFVRGKVNKKVRMTMFLIPILSIWPLWRFVYSSNTLYKKLASQNVIYLTRDDRDRFRSTGFPYPFIHSIRDGANMPPDGYDENTAIQRLEAYSSELLSDKENPNIMIIQLESFSDFEEMGVEGIEASVYAPLRQLQEECCSGVLVPNIIGGGTVNTERSVLTGSFKLQQYYRPSFSYVRYLRSQGYYTTGSHPNVSSFYSRGLINDYLGFEEYLFRDNFFNSINEWRCDSEYLPAVFQLFLDNMESEQPVFSFNVTTQGHWPYKYNDYYDRNDYWTGENVQDTTRCLINNYCSLISETQKVLVQELETLVDYPEPIIVLLYGDHKPWLTQEAGVALGDATFYDDLGISFNLDTEEGLLRYISTPYLIWANTAAKEQIGNDFTGNAPTISPCYLMNILFEEIGWEGPAYMQYTSSIMGRLPVIYTNGRYIEDGTYTNELSYSGKELLKEYEFLQYYVHYRPELAG